MSHRSKLPKKCITKESVRIEVCGGIAAGKTTLAKLMRRIGFKAALEHYKSNPFLDRFYSAPERYALETEITFLLQHYSQIKANSYVQQMFICDYSLYLDLAYAIVTLDRKNRRAFDVVYNTVYSEIGPPHLLIYLHCSAETEMERIKRRRRSVERSISIEYLKKINCSLKTCVERVGNHVNVIEIDSERLNFANDPHAQAGAIELVGRALSSHH